MCCNSSASIYLFCHFPEFEKLAAVIAHLMASIGCGYKCLQLILLALNSVVLGGGLGLVILASIVESNSGHYGDTSQTSFRTIVIFIICLGCVIFLVGFIGFCGTCLKSSCLLVTYSVLLGVLSLTEICCGITMLIMRGQIPDVIGQQINDVYAQYKTDSAVRNSINRMQKMVLLCG
ncbi:unnamed protein product [Dicrocoelium dendriticum]|nr:unnamed protein product [Dicrocoelium dendriticum]